MKSSIIKKIERCTVYPVIPSSKQLAKELNGESFCLFGTGNEKRDLILLIRGDLRILSTVQTNFFGCTNCGYIGFRTHCECNCPTIYHFDGIWKGCKAVLALQEKDTKVLITKL